MELLVYSPSWSNSHYDIYSLFFWSWSTFPIDLLCQLPEQRARRVRIVSAFKSRGIICPWLQRINHMN